jgi:hypothetical protein
MALVTIARRSRAMSWTTPTFDELKMDAVVLDVPKSAAVGTGLDQAAATRGATQHGRFRPRRRRTITPSHRSPRTSS